MTGRYSRKGVAMSTNYSSGWINAYETAAPTLWQERPIPVIEHAISLLKDRDHRLVVDVACGDGRNLIPLISAGFLCAGVDISSRALRHTADRLRRCNQSAFLIPGQCEMLPFADASVHAVTAFDVFGQLEEPERFLGETKRILTSDGTLVLNAFTTSDSEFGRGERIGIRSFCYKGTLFRFFVEDEVREFLKDWDIIHFARKSWDDPPHGDFRPYPHKHDNYYIAAIPRS
jgi:ubiquinone/menaquinone biosynthesis C-methylase UbiE